MDIAQIKQHLNDIEIVVDMLNKKKTKLYENYSITSISDVGQQQIGGMNEIAPNDILPNDDSSYVSISIL